MLLMIMVYEEIDWFCFIKFEIILGICHRFENETLKELQLKSIVNLSNQIDNTLQLTDYLSTQPFSILDLPDNNLSS